MKISEHQIIDALEKYNGFVSFAAQHLKVTPQAVYDRISKSKELKQKYENIRFKIDDKVENILLDKIFIDRDTASIIFYCKCKLKHRGYVERQEIADLTGEQKIIVEFIDGKVNG